MPRAKHPAWPQSIACTTFVDTCLRLIAAKKAVQGFEKLPSTASRTFIYTGNFMNKHTLPFLVNAGMGKAATAHLLATAQEAYEPKGYRSVAVIYLTPNSVLMSISVSTRQTRGSQTVPQRSEISMVRHQQSSSYCCRERSLTCSALLV